MWTELWLVWQKWSTHPQGWTLEIASAIECVTRFMRIDPGASAFYAIFLVALLSETCWTHPRHISRVGLRNGKNLPSRRKMAIQLIAKCACQTNAPLWLIRMSVVKWCVRLDEWAPRELHFGRWKLRLVSIAIMAMVEVGIHVCVCVLVVDSKVLNQQSFSHLIPFILWMSAMRVLWRVKP